MNKSAVIPIKVAPAAFPTEIHLPAPPPLALYIHFPWCVRKCPYCDFNSHQVREEGIPEQAYLAALVADLEAALPQIWGRRVLSVFIGGGTPSLLSAAGLEFLLDAIRMRVNLQPDAEITLEANPGAVEAEKFAAFRSAGVTRVSLGIQSFNNEHLKALGRIHDSAQAFRAIELAAKNFATFNLDLMYALPQQTLQQAEADLEKALSFEPPHLSCYHLTLEPNTLFHRTPPPLPDADMAADMQIMIESKLAEVGYQHYETSAFAKAGHRCRHNLNYWRFGDYLGIGAGAHSKLSSAFGIVRQMRHKHPAAYLAALENSGFIQDEHALSVHELPFEFMMNALRLNEGFTPELLHSHTGLHVEQLQSKLLQAQQRGLLAVDQDRIQPTQQGQHFLNDLLQIFL